MRRLRGDPRPAHQHLPWMWRDHISLSAPVIAVGRGTTSIALAVTSRRRRPWLAMVALPLEMSATMCLLLWWTWPVLIFCVWWWADATWRWTWFVGVEAGLFGTEWCYAGAVALGNFADSRGIVAGIWAGCAVALAAVSANNRYRNGSSPFYPGY